MELILGYIGALVVGITLGLLGGGGSILSVPIFVYLLGINPVTATGYSLFVVGATSLVGALRNIKTGNANIKVAVVFAIPSFIAVYLTRRYLIPSVPPELFTVGNFAMTKDLGIMLLFAVIMLMASFSMIKNKKASTAGQEGIKFNYPVILLEGAIVGVLTGCVGAGGGFLIVPVLVLFINLPMKQAVATSLIIVAAKSLIGFIGDVQTMQIDWVFLLCFTAISMVGILIGIYLNKFIDDKRLKKMFGWFVLIMAIYIIIKELFI